jgi:hypothetical protein
MCKKPDPRYDFPSPASPSVKLQGVHGTHLLLYGSLRTGKPQKPFLYVQEGREGDFGHQSESSVLTPLTHMTVPQRQVYVAYRS